MECCSIYKFCEGGCIVEASHEGGIDKIDGFSCIETKEMYMCVENALKMILPNFDNIKCSINPTVRKCIEQYLEKNA